MKGRLPALYLCVLPFVLRNGRLPKICLASKFEAHLDRAEKVCASFVAVFQRRHNVGRTCKCFEQLDLLERIRHCITALETVTVSEQDLDTFVIISLATS